MTQVLQPWCGPAPDPSDLWLRWNFDPLVLAGLLAAQLAFKAWRPLATTRQNRCFGAGLTGLFIAFVSPLCALTVALFSARVAHHLLLVAGVAPLLALAFESGRRPALPVSAAFLLHTLVFWLWHAPGLYSMALASDWIYWSMQASLLTTSWLMWRAIFAPTTGRGYSMAALLGSILQMGMLGALLTFAARPLYAPHFTTTLGFGLDPLSDQQLAGILMWVPASLPYLAVASLRFSSWLASLSRNSSAQAG